MDRTLQMSYPGLRGFRVRGDCMVMEVLIKDSIGGLGNRSNLQLASSGIQMGLGRLRVYIRFQNSIGIQVPNAL